MTIIPREPFDRALSDHVDILGTIGFAQKAGMTTRQLNGIRSGDQPNPFHRAAEWSRPGSAITENQLVSMVCEANDPSSKKADQIQPTSKTPSKRPRMSSRVSPMGHLTTKIGGWCKKPSPR